MLAGRSCRPYCLRYSPLALVADGPSGSLPLSEGSTFCHPTHAEFRCRHPSRSRRFLVVRRSLAAVFYRLRGLFPLASQEHPKDKKGRCVILYAAVFLVRPRSPDGDRFVATYMNSGVFVFDVRGAGVADPMGWARAGGARARVDALGLRALSHHASR